MKMLLLVHKILPPFYHYSLIHIQSARHNHAKEIPKHKNQPKKKKYHLIQNIINLRKICYF